MKKRTILPIVVSLGTFFLAPACKNPYIVHNLERPVYLTGVEIRSNVITDDDPSHPLNELFQRDRSAYTVTIPYDAVDITIAAFPEEGAFAQYETFRHMELWQDEVEFIIEAYKEHRLSTLYTIKALRGKPEAQLAGIELFVSDDGDPNKLEAYEKSSFIINYIPSRGSYQVKLPNYTRHVALVLRSFNTPEKMVYTVDYRFQTKDYAANDGSKVTIDADGITPLPGGDYCKTENTIPITALPSWWPGLHNGETDISLGSVYIYPGQKDSHNAYFGMPADFGNPDPDSEGKLAYIALTARANDLDPKEYVLELRRELDYAYLGEIGVFKKTVPPLPQPPVTETETRLIGNFAPSVLSYDAALPKDTGAVVIAPVFESHTASSSPKWITYARYYYGSSGDRYYIPDDNNPNVLNTAAPVKAPPEWTEDYTYSQSDKFVKPDDTPVEFAFDVQDYGIFKSMEVVLKVEALGKLTNPNPYRVMARRQTARAVLAAITVEPGVLVDNIWDINGLSGFEPNKQSYTVTAGSGRTHARVTLGNTEGTADRTISIASSARTVNFHREGGVWVDDALTPFGASPFADIELKSRNTVVKITVSDAPSSYSIQEYTLNILSKNRNDIILPSDADSDGRMRAVFASGGDSGLTATSALPGDLIELTIEANLGYYVKLGLNTGGYKNGVRCKAEGFSMNDLTLVSDTADKKYRKYRFNMPDSNIEFEAEYEETAVAQNRIAYVAPRGVGLANRGGAYGTGRDAAGRLPGEPGFDRSTATATSWGRASWDLQAVINSYDGDDPYNFTEIWLLEGTYRVPDPDDYTNAYYNSTDPLYKGESNPAFDCFPVDTSGGPGNYKAGPVSGYHVNKYTIAGIQNKKDLAFVLRNEIHIFGGFKETDTDTDNRHGQAGETILSGVFADGETQAHHVIIMADAEGVILDGLTVTGGLGPELDDNHSITVRNT
ncbi:MAG: hypothetical protein LBI85_06930, partial [Spirochaetaceae bacterium]|nr:hypothetical protein [Spirochaetaceae bacterium]